MAKRKAFGTVFEYAYAPTGPFTTVAQVKDIQGPSVTRETIDVTTHDSPNEYMEFLPGLKDGGEVQFELEFDPTAGSSHEAFDALFESDDLLYFRIRIPGSITGAYGAATGSHAFAGVITQMGASYPVNGSLRRDVRIKISGKPVWTPLNAWSPLFLSSLYLWLDGRSGKLASLSPDVLAGTGQQVRAWRSRDVGGLLLEQATGNKQPLASANGVVFDGVDDVLVVPSTQANSNPVTVGVAMQTPGGSVPQRIVNFANLTGYVDALSLFYDSNGILVLQRSNTALSSYNQVTAAPPAGYFAAIGSYGAAGLKLRTHNNATPTVNSTTSNTPTGTHLAIGASPQNTSFYSGEIRDIVIAGTLSAAEETLLGQFLAARAGVQWAS